MVDNPEPRYWIIVGSPENFAKTAEHGFTVQGMKSRHRKKAERMSPGDKLVYYLTGKKAFGAIATVTSDYFESHDRIWESNDPKKAAEDYPYRVEIKPELVLDDGDYPDAQPLAAKMTYTKKWPAKNWTLAFQGNVHEIGKDDFLLLQDALAAKGPVLTKSG